MAVDLVKALLTSPVLVAAVPALLAVLAGRHLLAAKDERIASVGEAHAAELRAKDAEIAALQWLTPAKMQEEVQAIAGIYEVRTDQLKAELTRAHAALEQDRELDAGERASLIKELEIGRQQLTEMQQIVQAAREAADKLAALSDSDLGEFRSSPGRSVSGRAVYVHHAKPPSMPRTWGRWRYSARGFNLEYRGDRGQPYWVELSDCTNSAQVLDWIAQVNGKRWSGAEDVGHLVEALDDLLGLQENYCGFGVDKPGQHPRQLVKDNVLRRSAST